MKKTKKIVAIAVVSVSLLVGAGIYAYVEYNNNVQANMAEKMNQMTNVMKVEKGDIKTVVEAAGKVYLTDENNPNSTTISLSVNQYDISKLQVNQKVEIKSKVFPEDIVSGVITEVSNISSQEGNPTYIVKVAISNPILESGEITYSEVNIRKGPSAEYNSIAQLGVGTKVKILEKKNNFIKIRTEDNKEGWVAGFTVKSLGLEGESIESKISKNDVVIRESSSSNSKSLGKLVRGEKVKIVDKKDDWYKVEVNDETTGWVQESDLVLQKLMDGMSVTGSIVVSEKKDVLKVPIAAVQKDENGYFVTMADTNEKRYVEVGENDSENIEVTTGLSENDRITTQAYEVPAKGQN